MKRFLKNKNLSLNELRKISIAQYLIQTELERNLKLHKREYRMFTNLLKLYSRQ